MHMSCHSISNGCNMKRQFACFVETESSFNDFWVHKNLNWGCDRSQSKERFVITDAIKINEMVSMFCTETHFAIFISILHILCHAKYVLLYLSH